MTDREKLLDAAARVVIAHIENFYQDHLPGCAAAAGDGKVCDCGLDTLRAALTWPFAPGSYLDLRTAQFVGRVGDEMLDEIRVAVDGAYEDGFADGQEEPRPGEEAGAMR